MIKSKALQTVDGQIVNILHTGEFQSIFEVMKKNRSIHDDQFFSSDISLLHDPYLLPDMEAAVARIEYARKKNERIVVFGDYDVDGVSSTALLVRFLSDFGYQVSYRLPHRVHDGYGLKNYFFDELREKNVSLVITVDCGTRDIGPIRHAKSLGIDVIITDHHAVPDIVPEEVIAIINPKRKDSPYPFRDLAGSGVAFKLLQALAKKIDPAGADRIALEYIDLASLGTVADCMPLIGENRVITSLGLKQMSQSKSKGLQQFLTKKEHTKENDADIIGFQIGPRINAAGRMDTPMTALKWLLASEEKADLFFEELEYLNEHRKETTEKHLEEALQHIDINEPVLIYASDNFDHGIIGLVAGRLSELYGKPTIILKNGGHHVLTRKKGDEIEVSEIQSQHDEPEDVSIASCRSPEWCSIIDLLETCKNYFVRFGGHRQAAGFTIKTSEIPDFKKAIIEAYKKNHPQESIPGKMLSIDCLIDPKKDISKHLLSTIDRFRPFGIGNRKPLFLLADVTLTEVRTLGKDGNHRSMRISENKDLKLLFWKTTPEHHVHLQSGNIISLIVEIEKEEWNGRESIICIVKNIIL